jgi:hypothetical protein
MLRVFYLNFAPRCLDNVPQTRNAVLGSQNLFFQPQTHTDTLLVRSDRPDKAGLWGLFLQLLGDIDTKGALAIEHTAITY